MTPKRPIHQREVGNAKNVEDGYTELGNYKKTFENRIFELGLDKQSFATLQAAKRELDLQYITDKE